MSILDKITDPATGQSLADIEAFLRSGEPGADVAIRNTHVGILEFVIVQIESVNPKSGRLYTNKPGKLGGAAWYMTSGKSCMHPKGQSRLFIPTDAIRDYVATHPAGTLSYAVYTPGTSDAA